MNLGVGDQLEGIGLRVIWQTCIEKQDSLGWNPPCCGEVLVKPNLATDGIGYWPVLNKLTGPALRVNQSSFGQRAQRPSNRMAVHAKPVGEPSFGGKLIPWRIRTA